MKLGQKVTFTLTYLRRGEYRPCVSGFGKEWWHYWKSVPCQHQNGIFIGYRSIQNGINHIEDGYRMFEQRERIKVALVVPSLRHNPIYVNINSMQKVDVK